MSTSITIETPDALGLVHRITGIFYAHHLNITHNEEHVEPESGRFFMTTEVVGKVDEAVLGDALRAVLPPEARLRFTYRPQRPVLAWGEFGAGAAGNDEVVLLCWNTDEGRRRLAHAWYKESFYQLAHVYQPQSNPFFCGVSSSVMVLNALRLKHGLVPCRIEREAGPDPERTIQYRLYCQRSFLNEETEKVKPAHAVAPPYTETRDRHFDPGLALHQVRDMLHIYKAHAALYTVEDHEPSQRARFQEHLCDVLADPERFMIVNYEGRLLGTATGGHFAPVAAYDVASDSVLVLDVAAHKNPWYWAPVPHLLRAMNTRDGDHWRGYLVVSDAPGGPTFAGDAAPD